MACMCEFDEDGKRVRYCMLHFPLDEYIIGLALAGNDSEKREQ